MSKFDLNEPISESVTFEEAINFTQALMAQMEAEKLNDRDIQSAIAALVKSENGARGFFVTYLTSDRELADHPSTGIIRALQSSPNIVSELLVKNIAMSTAMAITHRRNQNEEMARESDRVCTRTVNLIQQLQLAIVSDKLKQLQESITTGAGVYQVFLQRWGYDEEQRQAIQNIVTQFK
jgi:hypothetical protein